MMEQVAAKEKARVIAGISYYDALHERLVRRMSVYTCHSSLMRLKALYAFAREGGYTATHGSARFGWKELLVDAYVGVPFGPLLRRFFPW